MIEKLLPYSAAIGFGAAAGLVLLAAAVFIASEQFDARLAEF